MNIESLVTKLKSYSFSDEDMKRGMEGKTKIICYPDLKDYKNINELLHPYDSVIILYLTSKNYGHWTCLFINPNDDDNICYFDSYGGAPDNPLSYNSPQKNISLGQDRKYLTMLMDSSPYNISYNHFKLQKLAKNNSECGRYCILRLNLSYLSDKQFANLLKNNKNYDSDFWVTILTAFIN